MGSGGINNFLLDASTTSSECPRNAIVSSMPSPGFLFRASKSSLLDPRAQEFRPKTVCASTLPLLYPCNYPCVEFHPPIPPCAQELPPPPPSTGTPGFCRSSGRETTTRSLLLSSVPVNVSEVCLVRELEAFGPLRAVEMEEIHQGMVTVHFFDVRHAQAALMEIQEQHMLRQSRLAQHYTALMRAAPSGNAEPPPAPLVPRPARGLIAGFAVWAQYCGSPMIGSRLPDAHNQGTLVVFNLDSEVSPSILKNIFEAFGPVRELRETPSKRHHRFVEFYDVRDAARALAKMNGQLICDKRVKIEFSRPGGQARRLRNDAAGGGNSCVVPAAFAPDLSSFSSLSSFPRPAGPPPDTRFFTARSSQDTVKIESLTRGPFTTTNSRVVSGAATSAASSDAGQDGEILVRRKVKNGSAAAVSNSWNVTISEERRFTIDVREGSSSVNPRTTVMIKNIPNKYSQKLLLNMLDQHCISCNEQIADANDVDEPLSAYDFVYLPIDFKNLCNVGYGFVNLTSSKATWRLYKAFHKQPWEAFNSKKICEVTYARLQGLEALKEHFKNSKFACDTDEYLPVIFSPARDGKTLSEPMAIGGRANSKSRQQQHASSPPPPPPPMPTYEGPSPSSLTIQRHFGGVDSDFTDSAAPADDDLDGDVNVATIEDHGRQQQKLLPDSGILNDGHHNNDHLLPSSSLFPDTYATTNGNSNGSNNPAVSVGCLLHTHECKHHPSCPQT